MEKEVVEIKKEDIEVKEVGTQNTNVVEEKSEPETTHKKGNSIAAMVLGIVSVVLVGTMVISIPCAILAIILGTNGQRQEPEGKGMAKAGVILGIISISILAAILLFFASIFILAIVAAI